MKFYKSYLFVVLFRSLAAKDGDLKKEQNIRIPYSKLTKDIKDNEIYCAFGFSNLYKIASLSLCLA